MMNVVRVMATSLCPHKAGCVQFIGLGQSSKYDVNENPDLLRRNLDHKCCILKMHQVLYFLYASISVFCVSFG